MSYLLDTNVLSELRRKAPHPSVVQWVNGRPATTLFLSVLTIGELRKGVDALGDDWRRLSLLDWLEVDLPRFFIGRILPVDLQVADRWGRLLAQAERPLPAVDSLLAATALQHGLHLVTRNARDLDLPGLQVINPWQED
ncbi:MAG: type II toxin-antitoxin system VapC family toxin [Ramlibacter sp.]|nr:type II toxin-antitoxin system VapC family toxin [Ramlibacter sp.]